MMDRNREARRAAAMANGLQRRRHRTTTPGSLRDSPEDDGPLEFQETARLRDRTVKKDRDREMRDRERDRDRDRDRERERDRLSRSKRRRGDKYNMHGSNRENGGGNGGVGDDSSEESVNDEEDDDDDGPVRFVPSPNPVPIPSTSVASNLTSHRKSYPPPSKVFRVAPTWKAPDEMIGVSVPRKARSASTKRAHDSWSSGGGGVGGGEQINRQASSSPVRSTMTAAAVTTTTTVPSPSPGPPMSPSSSNISIKKKIKANGGPKQRPPKSLSTKSSPSIQDEIEIEVAEVLYGLMRQSQGPSKPEPMSNDSAAKLDSRSTSEAKSRVSSPISTSLPHHSSSAPPLTTVAPKRKRPRTYPDETSGGLGPRSSPISSVAKVEPDQAQKPEAASLSTEKNRGSIAENGDLASSHDAVGPSLESAEAVANNGVLSEVRAMVMEELGGGRSGMVRAKVEEASSTPKLESTIHLDRLESTKSNSSVVEKENRREEKFEIDLMAPPSPEKEEEMAEYGRGRGGDEKSMVTDREAVSKEANPNPKSNPNEEGEEKGAKCCSRVEFNAAAEADETKAASAAASSKADSQKSPLPLSSSPQQQQQQQVNLNGKERNVDLQFDLGKSSVNDSKFQKQPPPKSSRDDAHSDKPGGQTSSVPLPMSMPAGWHGGLPPMGYVGPLQGVVSMDGTTMASPPLQPPHFLFSQPRPKRCATHCYIARSISVHQQMMKMNPFWPAAAAAAAAAGTAPLFGAKPYNLNMVPSAELHPGRGGVVNSAQDGKGQPYAFFPGQPASSSKDKPPQAANIPDAAQKKQFLLQPGLPPGAASNILHAPALFFPMGQQQAAAAASARPGTGKATSTAAGSASTSMPSLAPMSAAVSNAPAAGPAMTFNYGINGNDGQLMAILGNGPYPYMPAHVGAAPPYRGSHPQTMSFFNGSFYSPQMLHPSQLQQQQPGAPSQSLQMQQQNNHQNASISTASSSSQKHMQNQQQRTQGTGAAAAGHPSQNPGLQNFQGTKGRPQQDMGGEDSPSTADSRNRQNLSVYGQNFAMPFHSPNFALMPSSLGGGGSNAAGVPNGNHGDKKQNQQQQPQHQALKSGIESLTPPFPMSFTSINGATTPGLDISSMAHNHAILQSLPEAARHNYQMMAVAAAAQAAQQKKNNYRSQEDGKSGIGPASDPSNMEEERKAMAARASAASVGQSIAFSRDLAENNVVDSSARSLNLVPGSARPARSTGPTSMTNSSASNSQQQQQSQMLFSKQQQYVASTAANARSKTPSTSNGGVYPDQLTSSSAKFPNTLPGFSSLVQTSGAPSQSPQWKNSVRPNISQGASPSMTTNSTVSNMKNLPQQQGRPQQNHTQISFGAAAAANPKASSSPLGQQTQNSSQAPSSPMMVGSPSNSSMSKSAGGSPRTAASASAGNKSGGQASTLSSQQGRNSPSPSLSSQKQSILGNPHMLSTSGSGSKSQLQQSQQQPQLSKQSIQQTQLYFSNAYMQASANTSAAMSGSGYYLQRHRTDNQQHQQQQGSKPQGSAPPTSSSGMLSLCTPVSLANSSTSDPAKAVAAAAAASNMKGGLPSQGMFNAAQFAAQSGGGVHQLMPASFPYVTAVQVKPAEQKQPAGE